jgi:predicted  nucleic acid-binding Zn-ribbon protein
MFDGWTIQQLGTLIMVVATCLSPIILLVRRVDKMEIRMNYHEKDITAIRQDIHDLKVNSEELKDSITDMRGEFGEVRNDLKWIRSKME